jgi:hypothetical protein
MIRSVFLATSHAAMFVSSATVPSPISPFLTCLSLAPPLTLNIYRGQGGGGGWNDVAELAAASAVSSLSTAGGDAELKAASGFWPGPLVQFHFVEYSRLSPSQCPLRLRYLIIPLGRSWDGLHFIFGLDGRATISLSPIGNIWADNDLGSNLFYGPIDGVGGRRLAAAETGPWKLAALAIRVVQQVE